MHPKIENDVTQVACELRSGPSTITWQLWVATTQFPAAQGTFTKPSHVSNKGMLISSASREIEEIAINVEKVNKAHFLKILIRWFLRSISRYLTTIISTGRSSDKLNFSAEISHSNFRDSVAGMTRSNLNSFPSQVRFFVVTPGGRLVTFGRVSEL